MFNLVLDKPLKRRFSDVLQNNLSKKFHKALRKTQGPLLKKLWSYRLELYKNQNSGTGLLLTILRNFLERLFCNTPLRGCFYTEGLGPATLLKKRL